MVVVGSGGQSGEQWWAVWVQTVVVGRGRCSVLCEMLVVAHCDFNLGFNESEKKTDPAMGCHYGSP